MNSRTLRLVQLTERTVALTISLFVAALVLWAAARYKRSADVSVAEYAATAVMFYGLPLLSACLCAVASLRSWSRASVYAFLLIPAGVLIGSLGLLRFLR